MTPALAAGALLGSIPSPTQGVWHLGPIPVRAYALCIIAGIVLAVWLGEKRYVARGGAPGTVVDISVWAVPFGIVGGRIYHVITNPEGYFGAKGDPVRALYIWEGGLGIWGAISLGALGVYIAARRRGLLMPPLADALAPGILAAQAIGRWGNWFNNELYGRPTTLPWGLEVWGRNDSGALVKLPGLYHPTFLYEFGWNSAGVAVLLWADRRFRLGHGRVFALYVAVYTSGRLWIEALRFNDQAHIVLGLRVNLWTSMICLLASVVAFVVVSRRHPGREGIVVRGVRPLGEGPASDAAEPGAQEPAGESGTGTGTGTGAIAGKDSEKPSGIPSGAADAARPDAAEDSAEHPIDN